MATRIYTALLLSLALTPLAGAQTVRFDTNVGNIDLVLNPRGLPELRGHVDNMLAYVEDGRYEHNILNRAHIDPNNPDDPLQDFILQFGAFSHDIQLPPADFTEFDAVERFDSVVVDFDGDGQVDFNTENLSNTRSTVSLALVPGQPNSGSSSFFVNVGNDNSFLNLQGFVPFAVVPDMSTVDYIMRLNQIFLVDSGASPFVIDENGASTASRNIPVVNDDNLLVFVERAFVLDPNPVVPVAAVSAFSDGVADLGTASPGLLNPATGLQTVSIPEPPALVLVVGALMVLAVLKGPRY